MKGTILSAYPTATFFTAFCLLTLTYGNIFFHRKKLNTVWIQFTFYRVCDFFHSFLLRKISVSFFLFLSLCLFRVELVTLVLQVTAGKCECQRKIVAYNECKTWHHHFLDFFTNVPLWKPTVCAVKNPKALKNYNNEIFSMYWWMTDTKSSLIGLIKWGNILESIMKDNFYSVWENIYFIGNEA